jgi:uncharacterized protein (TIGR03435 family)
MNIIKGALFTIVAAAAAIGQDQPPRAEFEVASVKKSATPEPGQYNIGVHIDGAMVSCTYLSLKSYISMAYQVPDTRINGPEWLDSEKFDIVAKLPAGGRDQLRAMIQSLLADRFKLVLHKDSKEFPVYALVVGKNGLKLKESAPDAETDGAPSKSNVNVDVAGGRGGTVVNLGPGSYISYGLNKLEGKKVPMASLVDSISRFVDRPVVDMTNLTARYDLTLEYSIDELRNLVRASGTDPRQIPDIPGMDPTISIFGSLEAVGLKLEPRKAPLDILVIDHIEKTPTAN